MTTSAAPTADAGFSGTPASPVTPGPLHVNGVTKSFPTASQPLVVLRDVTFTLNPGQTLAIVGASGSGKSTLLNIIGTLERPTAGSLSLDGIDPFTLTNNALAAFRGRRIGFVFQDHHLLPQLTALENVLIARMAIGVVESAHADRAGQLLQQVGLEGRTSHLPGELSGGERQRVAIARALMNEPALLLADEPTGNLDSQTAASVADLLLAASTSSTILIAVTHSEAFAARFATRMKMTDGELGSA